MAEKAFLLLLCGVAGGVLGGMGLGGGTLLIPLLTIGLGVPQKLAAWLNLASFIPMSVVALIVHSKNKLVSFKDAVFFIVPALGGAIAGSFFFRRIDGEIGRIAFGWFLLSLGVISLIACFVRMLRSK